MKVAREGRPLCYVPGVVYVVPLRQSKATKYYTVIRYDGSKVKTSTMLDNYLDVFLSILLSAPKVKGRSVKLARRLRGSNTPFLNPFLTPSLKHMHGKPLLDRCGLYRTGKNDSVFNLS